MGGKKKKKKRKAIQSLDKFRQLGASRPLKGPPHQSEKGTVTDGLGHSLPQTSLLPQAPPLPLGSDLGPVQPLVETPIEARVGP